MGATRCAALLIALLACWLPPVRAEEKASVEILQQAVEAVVKKAEPSIACILVSRSSLYRRFDRPSRPADTEETPGRLGGFDRPRFPHAPWRRDDERTRLLKSLDLSDPDNTPESYGSGVVL